MQMETAPEAGARTPSRAVGPGHTGRAGFYLG